MCARHVEGCCWRVYIKISKRLGRNCLWKERRLVVFRQNPEFLDVDAPNAPAQSISYLLHSVPVLATCESLYGPDPRSCQALSKTFLPMLIDICQVSRLIAFSRSFLTLSECWQASMDPAVQSVCISLLLTFALASTRLRASTLLGL